MQSTPFCSSIPGARSEHLFHSKIDWFHSDFITRTGALFGYGFVLCLTQADDLDLYAIVLPVLNSHSWLSNWNRGSGLHSFLLNCFPCPTSFPWWQMIPNLLKPLPLVRLNLRATNSVIPTFQTHDYRNTSTWPDLYSPLMTIEILAPDPTSTLHYWQRIPL